MIGLYDNSSICVLAKSEQKSAIMSLSTRQCSYITIYDIAMQSKWFWYEMLGELPIGYVIDKSWIL